MCTAVADDSGDRQYSNTQTQLSEKSQSPGLFPLHTASSGYLVTCDVMCQSIHGPPECVLMFGMWSNKEIYKLVHPLSKVLSSHMPNHLISSILIYVHNSKHNDNIYLSIYRQWPNSPYLRGVAHSWQTLSHIHPHIYSFPHIFLVQRVQGNKD